MPISETLKNKVIQRIRTDQMSISAAARKYGVSPKSISIWLKRGDTKTLAHRFARGESHYRGLKPSTRKQLWSLVAKYPQLSVAGLYEKSKSQNIKIGYHGLQNFLVRQHLNHKQQRISYVNRLPYNKGNKKTYSISEKEKYHYIEDILLFRRTISDISKHSGIGRATLTRWVRVYKRSALEGLKAKYRKGSEHHRSIKLQTISQILDQVAATPELSIHKLHSLLKQQNINIGHHGLQNILERYHLNTLGARLHYSFRFGPNQAQKPAPIGKNPTVETTGEPGLLPIPPPLRKNIGLSARFGNLLNILVRIFAFGLKLPFVQRHPLLAFYFAFIFSFLMFSGGIGSGVIIFKTIGMDLSWFGAGQILSFLSLVLGLVFFAYSLKYYMSVIQVLLLARYVSRSNKINESHKYSGGLTQDLSSVSLSRHPFVSVHLPLYNEKRVVNRLLEAVTSMDYDNYEVIVADDSTDETKDIVAEWINHPRIKISHRDSRVGFKGGALKQALTLMDPRAEFVIVFDSDFLPFPDTIEQFLKYFQTAAGSLDFSHQTSVIRQSEDSRPASPAGGLQTDDCRIAAIQGYQWHVLNKSENWITRGVRTEYAGSYVIERSASEIYQGLKQIAGSVFMIRADILKDPKYQWGTSITEDFELTLKLYRDGYKVVYTPYIQAPSECVSTIKRLIRQRMRWAEGHSFNIKKHFQSLLHSPYMQKSEKVEFLYLSPYYLQSAFFLAGTLFWFLSEAVFKVTLPFWTSVWGWSLVLTNMLSLPLMNIVGLFLEESEERDYLGVLSFLLLTYLLTPFQAYASVRGFLSHEEGPWFRTPKTGHITDTLKRGKFFKFVSRILPGISMNIGFSEKYKGNVNNDLISERLIYSGINIQGSKNSFRPGRRRVGKFVLSLLLIFSITLYSLSKDVPETYATNPSGPFYLRDEASSVLTGTSAEWRLADNSADTTDNITTIARVNNKKSAPLWFQFHPGATNSTQESGTSCSVNTPDNGGWIFETAFDGGGQIASGAWTFYVNETDNRANNVGTIQVCVWKVTVASGTISGSTLLFDYNDSTDHWDGADNDFSFTTGTLGPFDIGANEYLYIEYFSNLSTISGAGPSTDYDSIFRIGPTYSNPRVETPAVTIPETVLAFLVVTPVIPYLMHLWLKRKDSHVL